MKKAPLVCDPERWKMEKRWLAQPQPQAPPQHPPLPPAFTIVGGASAADDGTPDTNTESSRLKVEPLQWGQCVKGSFGRTKASNERSQSAHRYS
jgi:hypothetical protein